MKIIMFDSCLDCIYHKAFGYDMIMPLRIEVLIPISRVGLQSSLSGGNPINRASGGQSQQWSWSADFSEWG